MTVGAWVGEFFGEGGQTFIGEGAPFVEPFFEEIIKTESGTGIKIIEGEINAAGSKFNAAEPGNDGSIFESQEGESLGVLGEELFVRVKGIELAFGVIKSLFDPNGEGVGFFFQSGEKLHIIKGLESHEIKKIHGAVRGGAGGDAVFPVAAPVNKVPS